MAFSKGKRIEDETSTRIIDLAVNIGCKEGYDALTVTRLCKELNCDRRVVYNRFRDVDEINMIVAGRCNDELIAKAEQAAAEVTSFRDKYTTFIKSAFAYIYEKNSYFQYYTALYEINEGGIENGILVALNKFLAAGQANGALKGDVDVKEASESIWTMITGFSSMLANHIHYPYSDALNSLMFGIDAVYDKISK